MKKILIVEYKDEQEFSEMLAIACGFDVDIKTASPLTDEEISDSEELAEWSENTNWTYRWQLWRGAVYGAKWMLKQLGL